MKKEAISQLQLAMMIMLSVGLMNHVIIIPLLLNAAGRDGWFAVILTTGLFLPYTTLLFFTMKRMQWQHPYAWLKEHYGSVVARVFACLASVYLFAMASITLSDTVYWTQTSYFPQAPVYFLALLLVGLCFYNAHVGIRSIALSGGILLPFVVIFGFFVMTANIPHKDYTQLFPLFENGQEPIIKGILYCASGLIEYSILLFMQHHFQQPLKLKNLLILIIVLGGMIMGPLAGAIAEFGVVRSSQMRYPAFEEWRLVNLGRYVEHLDFLSIYQWLSGAYIRLSLSMFLIVDMFQLAPGKKRTLLLAGLYLLLSFTLFIPLTDVAFVKMLFTLLPMSLLLILFLAVGLFLLVVFHQRKRTISS